MFKSRYCRNLIIFTFIFILIKGILFYKSNSFKINTDYKPNNNPEYVRVYYDIATIPMLYQLEDFLNQSEDSVVFINWDRIPNLEKKLKNRKNVYYIKHIGDIVDYNIDVSEFKNYYRKHPNAKYIIHCNEFWFRNLVKLLETIPPENIEEINLYEDGSYASIIEPRDIVYYTEAEKLLQKFNGIKKVYHISGIDIINSPKCLLDTKCLAAKQRLKNDIITEASIADLKTKLNNNPNKKEEYFRILSFDYKKYQKQMVHPFGIYTFTVFRKNTSEKEHIAFMEELLYGKLNYLIKDKNVKWFYKEHPEKYQRFLIGDYMTKKHPEIGSVEKHLPLEMFYVADIVPDYLAGYSSGAYLNSPKEIIAAYIERPNDSYMYIIKKEKLINPGRIFKLSDYDDSLKSKIKRFISKIQVSKN